MNKVSIEKCKGYEVAQVKNAIKKCLEPLGGLSSFINPGDSVLLKVNLLMKRKPERVTTTHPSMAQAIAELVIEAGGRPMIGDSPGGYNFYNKKVLESIYDVCGMKEAAEKSGAVLNYNTDMLDISNPDGKIIKSIKTIRPVIEADKIINIPKIKTHMMTVYSGAVKNLFGIIPGSYKMDYHLRFDDIKEFSNALVDICEFAKPTLTIMDAIIGMEGMGPTAGDPREIGLVLASPSPYDLDVVASRVIGFEANQVPTIQRCVERGLCTGKVEDIEVIGNKIEDVQVLDYKRSTLKVGLTFYNGVLPKFITAWINRIIKPRPKFNYDICKKCGVCAKSCPPGAITMKGGKPKVDLSKCIRCFCCHELCNDEAIKIKRPWYVKIFLR